jgi:hypothetical protein
MINTRSRHVHAQTGSVCVHDILAPAWHRPRHNYASNVLQLQGPRFYTWCAVATCIALGAVLAAHQDDNKIAKISQHLLLLVSGHYTVGPQHCKSTLMMYCLAGLEQC